MPKLSPKKTGEELPQTERATSTEIQKSTRKAVKPRKTEPSAKKAPKKAEDRLDFVTRARLYLRDVSFEMRKVVWPSRKETIGSTVVVLVIVLLSGFYFFMVDSVLTVFIRQIIG